MRLTCPHCEAQYEVDESVIPEGGRDVQCSNCGTTWLQLSAAELRTAELAQQVAAPDGGSEDWSREEEAAAAVVASLSDADSEKPESAPKRRTLDDAVLNVLREEAEREKQARQAEGTSLETQGDLGLVPPQISTISPQEAEVEERDVPEAAVVSRAARRELLPDIEEINSTLRATSERGAEAASYDAPESLRQRRNGFRKGFLSSLGVMILLLLPYIFADSLATRFPATATALTRYSAGIDSLRIWLDSRMKSTTASMQKSETSTN
jgi:predicted Zn finger-like uncharacterized protein